MNNIYDNGYKIIGNIYNVKEYICKNCNNVEEIKEIIEELENYDAKDIVMVDYDSPFGYSVEYWKETDKVA